MIRRILCLVLAFSLLQPQARAANACWSVLIDSSDVNSVQDLIDFITIHRRERWKQAGHAEIENIDLSAFYKAELEWLKGGLLVRDVHRMFGVIFAEQIKATTPGIRRVLAPIDSKLLESRILLEFERRTFVEAFEATGLIYSPRWLSSLRERIDANRTRFEIALNLSVNSVMTATGLAAGMGAWALAPMIMRHPQFLRSAQLTPEMVSSVLTQRGLLNKARRDEIAHRVVRTYNSLALVLLAYLVITLVQEYRKDPNERAQKKLDEATEKMRQDMVKGLETGLAELRQALASERDPDQRKATQEVIDMYEEQIRENKAYEERRRQQRAQRPN